MCTWGKTPGKWIFSIYVKDQDGNKPGFIKALKRSLRVWFFGIGMGIPFISFLFLLRNFKILSEERILPFDRKHGLTVEHGYHGVLKNILIFLVYAIFVYYRIAVPFWNLEYTPIFNERLYFNSAEYLKQLGYSHMKKGEYPEARQKFLEGLENCTNLEIKDTLLNNLSWACYCLGEYEEALDYSKRALELGNNDAIEYVNYANALYALNNISEAEKAFQFANDIDNNNPYALYGLGLVKYDTYCFDEAIPFFEKYTSIEENDPYGWCYLGLSHLYGCNNMLKAKECLDKAYGLSPKDIFVITGLCNYYSYVGEYKEAENLYFKTLEENPDNYDLICNIASLYNDEGKHDKAIEFADRAIECGTKNYLPYRIKAEALFALGKDDEAIDIIDTMLADNPLDADAYYVAGDIYQDFYYYKHAVEYYTRALETDSAHYGANTLKTYINKRKPNITEQVSEFIEVNYLYYKSNDKYQEIKNRLKDKASVSLSDIVDLFNAARKDGDMFSLILTGDDYKYYKDMQQVNTVEYRSMNETTDYIRISSFSATTANDVLNIIDGIENSEDRYLVIDLRGNTGGDTTSGADILDFLLPDSIVCNLIYRDGYSDAYYSDDQRIEFKHIFVLIDEYSASCSELLTLGLKTYLDNVTVIGRKSFGKGVGQVLFEDKTKGFVIFLVNHYWNVRQENINEKGIIPDINVDGDSLEDFMAEVIKAIESL